MRYLPPVYTPVSWSEIWSAIVTAGTGAYHSALSAATASLSVRYPDYDVHLVDSGTSALALAIEMALARTSSITGGSRRVAVPAYACPDVATAVVGARGRLLLYDLEPATLAPDWNSVRDVLQRGATVLVVAHLYGRIVDLAPARALAAEYGAIVVEDAAQHAGGSIGGVRGGAQGPLGTLSFGRGKGINAGGGGALLCRRTERWPDPYTTRLGGGRGLGALVRAAVAETLSHPAVYGFPARLPLLGLGTTAYHPPAESHAMSASLCLLLASALDREAVELSTRRNRERALLDGLTDRKPTLVQMPTRSVESGALRTPVLLDPHVLGRYRSLHQLGVVRSYPRTLSEYPELTSSIIDSGRALPGSTLLAKRLYTLPTHSRVRSQDVAAIITLLSLK